MPNPRGIRNPEKVIREQLAEIQKLRAKLRAPRKDPAAERLMKDYKDAAKRVRELEAELAPRLEAEEAEERLSKTIAEADVPKWVLERPKHATHTPGVPTKLSSDWHVGETVFRDLIAGKNRYDRKENDLRVRLDCQRTIDLLTKHVVNPKYPGIVYAGNGDMVSGGIHEELLATDWADTREAASICAGYNEWQIRKYAEEFNNVFVPWTTGNHGRLTHKMQFKRRTSTSVDAMIADRLVNTFKRDRNITFAIAEGTAVLYKIYGHRFLLTHGDPQTIGQKGGDGIIGALGPIVRGWKKILARNAQIGLEFDTIVMGHWHQLMFLNGIIVNGSMKGYDEFAWGNGFPYEPPQQALWLTHPEWGVTQMFKVFSSEVHTPKMKGQPWVSVERSISPVTAPAEPFER